MREIIGDKVYDTRKASLIAYHYTKDGIVRGSQDYHHEKLYRTQAGSWFFVTRLGGFMSFLNARVLEPVSDDEVYEWFKQHNDVQLIRHYFPGRIHDA